MYTCINLTYSQTNNKAERQTGGGKKKKTYCGHMWPDPVFSFQNLQTCPGRLDRDKNGIQLKGWQTYNQPRERLMVLGRMITYLNTWDKSSSASEKNKNKTQRVKLCVCKQNLNKAIQSQWTLKISNRFLLILDLIVHLFWVFFIAHFCRKNSS